MGILIEYNPDLALRDISHFRSGERKTEECVPQTLEVEKSYPFLKKGQRMYWLQGEMPLIKTDGNEKLSLPLASIVITEATHCLIDGEVYTRGTYVVREVFSDEKPHFNGFAKI